MDTDDVPNIGGEPVDPEAGVILGIDFGGTKVAVGLATAGGELLLERRLDTDAAAGADQAVTRSLALADRMLAEHAGELSAVGVVSPGIVLDDRILLAPNVPGWEQLRLRELVADRFGHVPIAVGTDAKAAALAECRWGALAGADPGIFLSVGTGLAAAVVVGGQVLTGAHGAAGEIGYNLRGPHDRSTSASLEEAVAGRGLGDRATQLTGRPTTAAELFALAEHNQAAADLLAEALDELAVHVANLANTIDPERIAVGGGLTASADKLFPALRRRLDQVVPFPPGLVPARFEQDGALRGAVALAMDRTGCRPAEPELTS
ncbi:MAG TPA: ROK family protein [Pseudonocardiaceae bacterium]|nr:ROK family protein [Pseudonocardiaceae bacterium]